MKIWFWYLKPSLRNSKLTILSLQFIPQEVIKYFSKTIFLPNGEWIEKTKRLILNFSEMVWNINTKFSPVVKLYGNLLCTKYEGSRCTKFGFPAKTVKNIKWAWQVQFLSYTLQIFRKWLSFEYSQMILVPYFAISYGFNFKKDAKAFQCSPSYSSLWLTQYIFMNDCLLLGCFKKWKLAISMLQRWYLTFSWFKSLSTCSNLQYRR